MVFTNAEGTCSFAVFDADRSDGLVVLLDVQTVLAEQGYPAYLEKSRRGGHLWLFFAQPTPAEQIRRWLGPVASVRGLELYPRQTGGRGIGSLIRVPFGKHSRSGQRYPFLNRDLCPVAPTIAGQLAWLAQVERIMPPPAVPADSPVQRSSSTQRPAHGSSFRSIGEWNAQQDPFALIGRYVHLDKSGSGKCPFGSHHEGGRDSSPSFRVYAPQRPGGSCWFCYTWQHGGSAFDFLLLWHSLDTRTLWHRIQEGEV